MLDLQHAATKVAMNTPAIVTGQNTNRCLPHPTLKTTTAGVLSFAADFHS
jgi:hypothetical protein